MTAALSILGVGLDLPSSVDVRTWAAEHGGDPAGFSGWERACRAGPDDHPSTMGARALSGAITEAGIAAADLRLVVFTGSSRDYVPSWSVSMEVMARCGASDECLGLDVTAGCLATVAALELVADWLRQRGGGYGAVVAAERWSETIDYRDPTTFNLWAYGDSAGALVVGAGVGAEARLGDFLGAEFRSASQNNGHVLVPYGGTRAPSAPPGVNPQARKVSDRPKQEVTESYRRGYRNAYAALRGRFGLEPDRLVCNQMSPQLVGMLTALVGMEDRVVVTGTRTGHLGGTDVIVGLRTFFDEAVSGDVALVCASAAYGFGTGFVVRR